QLLQRTFIAGVCNSLQCRFDKGNGIYHDMYSRRLRSQTCLGLVYQCSKGCLVVHCQVCHHATVHLDVGLAQTSDQLAVGQAVGTGLGIDAGDPQTAEHTLLGFAVAVCVLACLDDGLLGNAIHAAACTIVAFGKLQNFLVTTTSGNASFNSSHDL